MEWVSQLPYILGHKETAGSKNCILFYWEQIPICLSFHVRFWCGVNDCRTGRRHGRKHPAVQRMPVDSDIGCCTVCLLPCNAPLRNTYIDSLSLCRVADHCPSFFFFRACRKRQGTFSQVFPIAVSWILHQWMTRFLEFGNRDEWQWHKASYFCTDSLRRTVALRTDTWVLEWHQWIL